MGYGGFCRVVGVFVRQIAKKRHGGGFLGTMSVVVGPFAVFVRPVGTLAVFLGRVAK